MNIVVINGSPRSNGNTMKFTACIETEMKELNPQANFEYVHLGEVQLELCRGCYQCLAVGEDRCPLKDAREDLEQKMHEADAIVFASPVYVANVTALFKNFVDRFAYICHRPRFNGKKALVVTSTGALAAGIVNVIIQVMVETWGFDVVHKVGVIVSPDITEADRAKQQQENEGLAKKAAQVFYNSLLDRSRPTAKLAKLFAFRLQQQGFMHANKDEADYQYWSAQGWLDPGRVYYIDARVNPLKLALARILVKFQVKKYPQGKGS